MHTLMVVLKLHVDLHPSLVDTEVEIEQPHLPALCFDEFSSLRTTLACLDSAVAAYDERSGPFIQIEQSSAGIKF